MAIAQKIKGYMEKSSWIRKMFEQGALLKAQHGAENVFDFSLGNPNLEPPAAVHRVLASILDQPQPGLHAYMANAGYVETRKAIAGFLSGEHDLAFSENEVIMTCGAAGALNVVLKALLDPGDELIVLAPYFVEYLFYTDNVQGVPKVVFTGPDFSIDLKAIEQALTPRTKAILINSPNNPTGKVYDQPSLKQLGTSWTATAENKGRSFI